MRPSAKINAYPSPKQKTAIAIPASSIIGPSLGPGR
jgi:hypothetical protein